MSTSDAAIARVSIKIPPLWKRNVRIWFAQVESQFEAAGITNEDTKYNHILGSLEPDIAETVSDLVLTKPAKTPYTTLKTRLITDFTTSDSARVRHLVQELELGDKKPSALLRQMQQLSQGQCTDQFLRAIFLDRLPVSVKAILATNTSATLEELGQMGDKIIEVLPSTTVAAVSSPTDVDSTVNKLVEQVTRLTEQVNQLSTRSRSCSRQRSSSRGRNTASKNQDDVCWYHTRYQEKARKCNLPCSFKQQQQGN